MAKEPKDKALTRWGNEGGAPPSDKNPKRPRDPNQLAKLMVDIASGEVSDEEMSASQKHASKGGKKGGKARAKALTPAERSEIASIAAQARWKKKD